MTDCERSYETIINNDLQDLLEGSKTRLSRFFESERGQKWHHLYDYANPIAIALCQGAALHHIDGTNGIKDFDIWFFYPHNETALPYRTVWSWDYTNPKFDHHPGEPNYEGRKVDVIIRSVKHSKPNDPVQTIMTFLNSGSASATFLAEKAIVLLHPKGLFGEIIWYRGMAAREKS